jgi:hypothetical protein
MDATRLLLAPTGLAAAGVGVGIGELAGLPAAATVTLAVLGWLLRLATAVSIRWWRHLPLVTIDPVAVAEPWRSLVREALRARQSFDEIVAQWPPGPLRDRLADATAVVHGATEEVWRVAQVGSAIAAPDTYIPEELSRRMRAIQRHPSPGAPGSGAYDEEAALAGQLQAIYRRKEINARVESHVRRVVVQLDRAVGDLTGLTLGADATLSAFDTIDRLSGELVSLHEAMREIVPDHRGPG